MLFRRILDPPTDQRSWVAWLLAAGVTLLLLLSIGLSARGVRYGQLVVDAGARPQPTRPEQLVFETLPAPSVSTASPAPSPAARPTRQPATSRPVRPPATPPSRARTVPDSGSSAGAAERPTPSIPTATPLPTPRFSLPASPTPTRGTDATPCTAPCLAAARVGVDVPNRTLTRAERDSMLQALSASIPAAAAAAGSGDDMARSPIVPPRPGGLGRATPVGGTSIPVGLPGGGPSRAQRQHDSTVNAHVLPILERLKRRADSVLAARRRDSLEAISKQRRDSTAGDSTSSGRRWP